MIAIHFPLNCVAEAHGQLQWHGFVDAHATIHNYDRTHLWYELRLIEADNRDLFLYVGRFLFASLKFIYALL